MQEMGMPIPGEKVAIQEPSGHSVVGRDPQEPFPVNTGKLREGLPANAAEMQGYRSYTSETTIHEDSTVKKGWKNGEATPEPPFLKGEKGADDTNNMGHRPNDPNIKSAYE